MDSKIAPGYLFSRKYTYRLNYIAGAPDYVSTWDFTNLIQRLIYQLMLFTKI
ncbi:hypothetical protein SAMN04488023_11266 [Pedobacter rhizosphaerae]|uniref:Uncharacterized protein n=1 Tax=Pedobacter rhizosphaerae TaxID=390241 RepID=A0A1H9QPN9_9SPHI|nr:hypothetical protein SAMN04488023_11266 [Pedobacter rhizosphaerae]